MKNPVCCQISSGTLDHENPKSIRQRRHHQMELIKDFLVSFSMMMLNNFTHRKIDVNCTAPTQKWLKNRPKWLLQQHNTCCPVQLDFIGQFTKDCIVVSIYKKENFEKTQKSDIFIYTEKISKMKSLQGIPHCQKIANYVQIFNFQKKQQNCEFEFSCQK